MPQSIAISLADDGEVVAAKLGGYQIRVFGYVFGSAGAATFTWKSGGASGTSLSGALPAAANGGYVAPIGPAGADGTPPIWFRCATGQNLYLAMSSAADVGGHLVYDYEKVLA